MSYNWQQPDWPEFRYKTDDLTDLLLAYADHAGRVGGLIEGLPEDLGTEAVLDLMIAEAIRTSAIEGETLNRDAVMSSIRNLLGLNPVPQPVSSRMTHSKSDGRRRLKSMAEWRARMRRNIEHPTLNIEVKIRGERRVEIQTAGRSVKSLGKYDSTTLPGKAMHRVYC